MANVSLKKRFYGWLQRTLFADFKNAGKRDEGDEGYADGEQTFYGLVRDPANPATHIWVPKGGAGFAGGRRYYFSDATNGTDGPHGLYPGPAEALNAAIDNGHDADNPATLMGYPGTYTLVGTLQLVDGISLESVAADANSLYGGFPPKGPVTIIGNVTATVAGDGWIRVAGVQIDGDLVATGAGSGGIVFSDVVSNGTSVSACTNQSTTANGLYCRNCAFITDGLSPDARAFYAANGSFTEFHDCTFRNTDDGDAFFIDGGSIAYLYGASYLLGAFNSEDGANQVYLYGTTISYAFTNAVFLSATTTFNSIGLVSTGCLAPLVTGTGTVNWQNTVSGETVGSTVLGTGITCNSTDYAPHNWKSARGVNSPQTIPDECDLYYCDTGDGAAVLNFPDITTQPEGKEIVIKLINAIGNVTLTPFTGQRIDLGAANATQTLVATANGATRAFVVDRISVPPRWRSITT